MVMSDDSRLASCCIRYDVLDGLRGVAAICVMIYHFTQPDGSPLLKGASRAVDLFFILSGFVIAHAYGHRLRDGMSILEYMCKRVIRLYPMFIVGILMGVPVLYALSRAGLASCSLKSIIGSSLYNSFFIPDINNYEIHNFTGIKVFHGELPPPNHTSWSFPTNPPAWSLFLEMFANFAFVALLKLKRKALVRTTVLCFAVFLVSGLLQAFFDNRYALDLDLGWKVSNFFGGFPRVLFGFSCGMLLYSLANDGSLSQFHNVAGRWIKHPWTLYVLLIFIFMFPVEIKGLYPVLVLAIGAPCLVFLGSTIRCKNNFSANAARFLGWMSYPVYCLHFPIGRVVFLMSDRAHYSRSFALFASIIITLSTSALMTKFYEEPVRAYLSQKLPRFLNFVGRTQSVQKAAEPETL